MERTFLEMSDGQQPEGRPSDESNLGSLSDDDLVARFREQVSDDRAWRRDRIRKTTSTSAPFRLTDDLDRVGVLERVIADGWEQSGRMHNRWRDLLRDIDLHSRAEALVRLAEQVDPPSLNLLLAAWWPEMEDHHLLGAETFVRLFRRAGYTFDQTEVADSPTSDLMVYRGTSQPASDATHGMSWTTDPIVAGWYAGRFADPARYRHGWVWGAMVNHRAILARFTGYFDSEVVVDPKGLRNVTLLELVTNGRPHPSIARRRTPVK